MSSNNITCTFGSHQQEILCNGVLFKVSEEQLTPGASMFWVYLGVYIFLMLFAGMMSGLSMGLLSLDKTQLEILEKAGKPKEQKYAKTIYPLVRRHHLLLVTLLLANAVAVESMPILMDKITHPIIAIIVSVTAVLIFGEILPQALCTRYGLAIGYYMSPLVYFLMFILFLISWPISKFLDLLLGDSHGTFFRRAELKELVDIHQQSRDEDNEEPLTQDEALIIKGALDLRDKVAKDVLVPLSEVFTLENNAKLDVETMKTISELGHSRIPIYKGSKENIIGILLVKSIISLDPDDSEPIRSAQLRPFNSFYENTPLYDVINICQEQHSHMCVVKTKGKDGDVTVGILTLEDVIEEILQEEIIDETDQYVDVAKRIKVARTLFSGLSTVDRMGFDGVLDPDKIQSAEIIIDEDESAPLIQ